MSVAIHFGRLEKLRQEELGGFIVFFFFLRARLNVTVGITSRT
jgi:hypothetical protein